MGDNMQYDRNDEITYDEGFKTTGEREYYSQEELFDNGSEEQATFTSKEKKSKTYPTVLLTQLVVCLLCAVFLYCAKEYFPELYSSVMDSVTTYINDSLVVEGNNINDYFVLNG
jgi:hypothetical protein